MIFKFLLRPTIQVQKEFYQDSASYAKKSIVAAHSTKEIFEQTVYHSITSACIAFFGKIRLIQTGKVNAYVLYVMIILVILLIYARFQS